MRKLYCFSYKDFKKYIYGQDLPDNISIISIIGSESTRGSETHLYEGDNILNLDFDDVINPEPNTIQFSDEMADRAYKFIKENINRGNNFYIHCNAGLSRSQAFVRFIQKNWNIDWETRKENPCIYYNIDVLNKLDNAMRKNK